MLLLNARKYTHEINFDSLLWYDGFKIHVRQQNMQDKTNKTSKLMQDAVREAWTKLVNGYIAILGTY